MSALGSDEQLPEPLGRVEDDAASPIQTAWPDCYAINCPRDAGLYVIFQPTRQSLIFVGESPVTRVDMGFAPSRLLELLIRQADTIVEREEILAYAWPDRVVTQSSLNQAVKSVREWLGDDSGRDIIQTVPRRGYQFNSSFLTTPGELPVVAEPDLDASTPSPNPSTTSWVFSRYSWPLVNAALLLLVIALGGSFLWRLDWDLLWTPGLVTSEQRIETQRLLYTAPDQVHLEALQAELAPLRERLLSLADTPGTLLFNRMHEFYEIMCIDQDSAAEFLIFNKSQLSSVTDKQLLECLK